MTDAAVYMTKEHTGSCCPARKGLFGFFRTHNFQPRYNLEPPTFTPYLKYDELPDDMVLKVLEAFVKKTYIADVCTYCGEDNVNLWKK